MRLKCFVAGLAMVMQMPVPAHSAREIAPNVVATSFISEVEDFIGTLDVQTENFAVRINPCAGKRGEIAEQRFYVWVGWRGLASANDASEILVDVLTANRAAGWEITRHRRLANGGINIAATNPTSGDTYALDSGFDAGPESYIVGFFTSRCFYAPPGSVVYGPWHER